MEPGCIGKSNTNNLPGPTDLTENPYGEKKLFFNDATQKSASVVLSSIQFWIVPRRPIFEKCPHLREKGGADAQNTRWVCADPYSTFTAVVRVLNLTKGALNDGILAPLPQLRSYVPLPR